jgi:hypothetical protein
MTKIKKKKLFNFQYVRKSGACRKVFELDNGGITHQEVQDEKRFGVSE